jgi:ubiquinone/menaquinone biosynthesis C-methylase UbiE
MMHHKAERKDMLTVEKVLNMSYVDFISFLQETNRCPGGKRTIHDIINISKIDRHSRVLEVGSNTGFTSLEIARKVKCKISGIDVCDEAIKESKRVRSLDTKEIQDLVDFSYGSSYEIPFEDNSFDLLVCGGATSFMDQKETAIKEYFRVLKPWGFLSIANLCYTENPPESVTNNVSKIIGVKINPWGSKEWMDVFSSNSDFEIYHKEVRKLGSQPDDKIKEYVEYFLNKEHIKQLPSDIQDAIRERWTSILKVFNENHKYLGFLMVFFRKRYLPEEPELFTECHDC